MDGQSAEPKRRGFRFSVDRRLVRTAIYSLVTIICFLAFKASEWLIKHYFAGGDDFSVPVALAIAVALAALFQFFYRKVEQAANAWLDRARNARELGLRELAQEVAMIRDAEVMSQRVVERLDQLLGTQGSGLYVLSQEGDYRLRAPKGASGVEEVSRDDPAVIRLALSRAPVVPAVIGSRIAAAVVCPLLLRGEVAGFLSIGHRKKTESFDGSELGAIARVADAAANALALLDRQFARVSAGGHATDTPDNLPQQVSRLIGREREIEEVAARLETSRLVTLLGTGGLGKTRLALEVATKSKQRALDGVWWVELSPLAEPVRVVEAAAAAMGVKEVSGEPLVETLVKHAKTRRLLLVLDNCEHVVEACAELANRLLQAAPNVRIVATSREPLHVAGEIAYPVPSLSVPDAQTMTADSAMNHDAIRLFVDRATAVMPAFRLTDENAATVAGICRRLDGIALAIELAASRVRAMSVEQLAARLDDRFRVLVGGDKTRPTRQQTLRASIAWSYDLLAAPERELLQRLCVFSGGWTLERAEDVAAGGAIAELEVVDLLTHLVDKSLVSMETGGRYRLMDSVREYAREGLEASGQLINARMRHLSHYLAFAEAASPQLVGPSQAEWLARIDAELENILAAHEWCDHAEAGAAQGLRLLLAIRFYWLNRGLMGLGHRLCVEALARPGARHATEESCRMLITAGQLCYFLGRYSEASPYLEDGLALARELGDAERCAVALRNLGMVHMASNDLAKARERLEEALAFARTLTNPRELACEINAVAEFHFLQAEFATADPFYRECLALARATGDGELIVVALCGLAMVAVERDCAGETALFLLEALDEGAKIGSRPAVQYVLAVCVGLAVLLGRWQDAARFHGAVEAQGEQTGLRSDPADRAFLERRLPRARDSLGAEAFDATSALGRLLSVDQARTQARDWLASLRDDRVNG
jgi:predicted ATPase